MNAADYYADPDVAALAELVVIGIPGAAHELIWEACDGDVVLAREVVALAKENA